MQTKEFTATIRESSPRYAEWMEVMGENEIPLIFPLPSPVNVPDKGDTLAYFMDLEQLRPDQRARLVKHLAAKFSIPEQEVASMLDEVGCPVLDEDVIVTIHNPMKWLDSCVIL